MHAPEVRDRYIEYVLVVDRMQFGPGVEQPEKVGESAARLDSAHLVQHPREAPGPRGAIRFGLIYT